MTQEEQIRLYRLMEMLSASLPMSRWLRFWSGSAKQHSASLCISVFSVRMMAA
ncbi:hypothetical protein BACCAP_01882 [Pseudoflavonifractor capillosus ATCC 29799]|uniref:Uncharacterized protein n=1 Tax=Pseudoflavonifractor capillosus ATCC 29799 TaxID=411467 RepID=A6NUK0_9FIRM|nr:hypothetical protein [Pseudoflavonifractor capillosus]EDN00051.1 hypothetical protein BACCAP_01882 [Pseudoflavonifractor capillosus ATCC 29799]